MTLKMKNSPEGASITINNGRVESSHQEVSIEKYESLRSPKNIFDTIPPFIRSKIEMTVQKAIQQKKIFSLGHSSYRTIKDTFIRRGWIQKTGYYEEALLSKNLRRPEVLEELFSQSLLREAPVTILWTRFVPNWNAIDPITLVNRFPLLRGREHFCSKIGLNNNLQDAYWFHEDGVSAVNFPRTYNLQNLVEVISFIEDYVITACISLLKIIIRDRIEPTDSYNLFQIGGKITLDIIYYAIKKCDDYITFREHGDLDDDQNSRTVSNSIDNLLGMYDNFLTNYSSIVEQKESFTITTAEEMKNLYNACRLILQSLPKFLPQVDSDGYRNLWLVKDSDLSCGKGVWVVRKLTDALDKGKISDRENTSRYIVQKYIERPLLIYNTKFDIRQWFLLTKVDPLQIWMYRKSYLRFSSQPFSLDDTHESVHLCNNSVQKNYTVHPKRHPALPQNNMWDSTTFRRYLKHIGQEDKWTKVIYPSMKASIIAALQVSQEDLVDRPNSFELYGADFILTEDFSPWLIEINSSPAMHASTSVTRRLCSQCFKDVIKVVIDYNKSQQANTGDFELIYQQCYFYKQVNPQWRFPDIYTYGTQLKLTNKHSQIEPLPIMNALKMKKWKNLVLDSTELDVVPKTLLRQQRKNLIETQQKALVNKVAIKNNTTSSTSITRSKKHASTSKDKSTNKDSYGNSKKTFLRSSQKIKYISLPLITTVDRTYFQVIERNKIEDISERPFEPEFNVSFFRVLSNSNLEELGINVHGMTVKESDKDNNSPFQDSKPHERPSEEIDEKQNLLPSAAIEEEPNFLEIDHLNAQNRTNFIPNGFEQGSDIYEEPQTRFFGMNNDIVFSNDSYTDIDSGENMVDSKRESERIQNWQANSLDEGFNDKIENDSDRNTNEFCSDFEEEYKKFLNDFYNSNHYEDFDNALSDCLLEDSLSYRIPYDNEQEVVTNEIDNKRLLNIYLTMKKENVDLYETNNDGSFVEIESANNVLNYIVLIQHSHELDYRINNDNSPLLREDGITVIQELEEKNIMDMRQRIQESMRDTVRNQLWEGDLVTTLNRKNNQQNLQPQACMLMKSHFDTDLHNNETKEFENQCLRDKSQKEKIHPEEESNQILPSSRPMLRNNRGRIFSVCVLLCISIVVFSGYIVLFHNFNSLDWIYNNIGKLKLLTD